MIELFNDRTLEFEQPVQVYRNLHKKCFSIRDRKTKLVIAHADGFIIKDAICKVGKGRFKVREEKKKNVHAYISGKFVDEAYFDTSNLDEIYYNPYVLDTFINKRSGGVVNVKMVYFVDGKAYIVK